MNQKPKRKKNMKEIIKGYCEVCGKYFEAPMCLFFDEIGLYCPICMRDYQKFLTTE